MAKITFAKGDYVTFLGMHSAMPTGRVIDVTIEGHPIVVFGSGEMTVNKKVFKETSELIPAQNPETETRRLLIFKTISAIFPELDNPPPTEDEPVEQKTTNNSSSDHGVDAGDYDGPA